MFDEVAYPYKLSRPIPLDPISHGNDGLFYYRTALSMETSHLILSAFSARPTEVKKLSDKQQGMLARVLAVTHIQTLKVVSYK